MCKTRGVAGLLLCLVIGMAHSMDLYDSNAGFEFIYHEFHSLLLTVHNKTCYFSTIHSDTKAMMPGESRMFIEASVAKIIVHQDKRHIWPTSLQDMRDKYEDRLADYHCLDKVVYILELLLSSTCEFESASEPLCNFTQDTTDTFDWTRHTGLTPTLRTGPTSDHTHGYNGTGHYVYIESSEPRYRDDIARLMSEVYGSQEGLRHCVSFSYNMHGDQLGTLNVYAVPDGWIDPSHPDYPLPNPIWSITGEQGVEWKNADVEFRERADFQVVFEAIIGNSYLNDIALDDITISRGPCSPPITCDFESWTDPTCGFVNDTTGDFTWNLGSGLHAAGNTAPIVDHTLGPHGLTLGHYMYIHSSGPHNARQAARITKQVTAADQGIERCVRFFYLMHSHGVGTLNVYATTDNFLLGMTPTPIWTTSGDEGDQWKQAEVTVPVSSDVELVIEGVIGQSAASSSDIAIDDITISLGECNNTRTGVVEDHLTCSFEQDWCSFIQDHTDNFDWRMNAGATTTSGTGPSGDHSDPGVSWLLGGKYVYIESSPPQTSGDTARLISEIFSSSSLADHCLRFYYNMHGSDIGTLNVYVVAPNSLAHLPSLIWSLSGEQGTEWEQAHVDVKVNGQFKVVFEGVVGNGEHGDIALDDVSLSRGDCSAVPVPPAAVRLVGGTRSAGYLEVFVQKQWMVVCSDGFEDRNARVACHMLGFNATFRSGVIPEHSFSPITNTSLWDSTVHCDGGEMSFGQCPLALLDTACASGHHVAIGCGDPCDMNIYHRIDGETWPWYACSVNHTCACHNGLLSCHPNTPCFSFPG